MNQNHVMIDESDGHPTIRIDDWELFDFIDDHLSARDFEYDYFTEENSDGDHFFVMHFRVDVELARLKEAIESIDPQEIQRIWNINN